MTDKVYIPLIAMSEKVAKYNFAEPMAPKFLSLPNAL